MSLGNYKLGDESLLTITTDVSAYELGTRIDVHVSAHDQAIRRAKTRLYHPDTDVVLPARGFPRPLDVDFRDLRGGSGVFHLRVPSRGPVGLYQLVVNTPKEAWLGDTSGLVWIALVEIVA